MSNRTVEITITDDDTGIGVSRQFSVDVMESFRFGRSTFLEMEYMEMLKQLNKSVLDMRMNGSFNGTVQEAQFVDSVPLNPDAIPTEYKEYTKLQLLEKIDRELERMAGKPEPTNYDKTFCDSQNCFDSGNCHRHIQHYNFKRPVATIEYDVDSECTHYDPIEEDK